MAEEAAQEMDEATAAMEAMAAGGGGDESTLSQDEIDNLLGFNSDNELPSTGIQALLDRSQENYERLPMLEVVFDRFVRSLSTNLRNFTSENVDVNIDSITSMRFEDYLNSVPLPALLAIFQAIEWENFGIITIDSSLTYSMVDILLGGGRTHRPIRIEGRPFTTIEQDIIKSLSKIMLDDMSSAFDALTPATFRLDRVETNPRFATIARPSSAVIVVSLRVDMDERGGKTEILIPYATIDPIKDLLLQMFSGESFGADVSWEPFLSNEVESTTIKIDAVLDKKIITLKELSQLKVGSTIIMNNKPTDDINLTCKAVPMVSGKIGSSEDKKLAISITDVNNIAMKEIV